MDLDDLIAVSERVPASVGAAWGVVVAGGLISVVLAFVKAHAVRSIIRGVPPDTVVVARFGHRGPQSVLVAHISAAGDEASGERFAGWEDFVRARFGDLWEFTRVRAHASGVSVHDAEDALQDAVTALAHSWRTARTARGGPEAYMRGIITHKIRDIRRPKRGNDQLNRRAGPLDGSGADGASTGRSAEDHVVDAEDAVTAAQDVLWLHAAIAQLPRRQREVVMMTRLQGMSIDDVADVLGIANGAVRTAKLKGLQNLRRLRDDRGEEGR